MDGARNQNGSHTSCTIGLRFEMPFRHLAKSQPHISSCSLRAKQTKCTKTANDNTQMLQRSQIGCSIATHLLISDTQSCIWQCAQTRRQKAKERWPHMMANENEMIARACQRDTCIKHMRQPPRPAESEFPCCCTSKLQTYTGMKSTNPLSQLQTATATGCE